MKGQPPEESSTNEYSTEIKAFGASASREEFEDYIAKFVDVTNWTYGERTPGELAGKWISEDGDGHYLVFDVNAEGGTFGQEFNGHMTSGYYAISDDGQIAAFSKWNGIGIGSRFRLKGDTITGAKGPNPSARWMRAESTR